jgi:tRNA(Met) C34 N-acetyltransferase TmcA
MASAGADWKTNPATQIKWGLDYMNSRYGSPTQAWNFWQANGWY